jgi:hypothetical protein
MFLEKTKKILKPQLLEFVQHKCFAKPRDPTIQSDICKAPSLAQIFLSLEQLLDWHVYAYGVPMIYIICYFT